MTTYIINEGGVNRQMTTTEIAEYKELCSSIPAPVDKETQAANAAAQAAAKTSAQNKLAALGLTADEIAAL